MRKIGPSHTVTVTTAIIMIFTYHTCMYAVINAIWFVDGTGERHDNTTVTIHLTKCHKFSSVSIDHSRSLKRSFFNKTNLFPALSIQVKETFSPQKKSIYNRYFMDI